MPDVELQDIDQIELSLTGKPAVKEDFIMTKTEDMTDEEKKAAKEKELKDEFEKLDDDARFALFLKAKDADEEDDDEGEDDDDKKKKPKDGPPNFNFDKTGDATKVALRAIAEAISGISDVPAPVAEFAKSITAKLPANGGGESSDSLIKIAKSSFPGLIEAVQEPLQAKLNEVTKTVDELEADKELAAMRTLATELPGDVEVVAKRLVGFKKNMTEEDFNSYVEEQKGLKTQVTKSAVFARQSSGQPVTGSAEAIIMSKAEQIVAKTQHGIKNMTDAIEFVGKTDPVLWGRYQEEIRNRPASARTA